MKRLMILLLAVGVLVAGCGGKSSTSGSAGSSGAQTTHVRFAKTKFALHAGLAFGAFHHFIYKPAKAGDFKHPLLHKLEVVKAGLAAVFVVHELKIALADARSSPLLAKLLHPLLALQDRISALTGKVKHGSVTASDLAPANGQISSIKSQAQSAGYGITESVPSRP